MSLTRTRPKCAGCKRPIPVHAPDLLVRELSEENPRLVTLTLRFHEQCAPAAVDFITERPAAMYRITHRYVTGERN